MIAWIVPVVEEAQAEEDRAGGLLPELEAEERVCAVTVASPRAPLPELMVSQVALTTLIVPVKEDAQTDGDRAGGLRWIC